MEKVREFLQSPAGKIVATTVGVLAVAYLAWTIAGFGGSDAAAAANGRLFIDSETGETFRHTLKSGDKVPLENPTTGKRTAYQAELCYWTKDGSIKEEPTPVLLKEAIGEEGPTFCPECDRLVQRHNPVPAPGSTAPPTRDTLERR